MKIYSHTAQEAFARFVDASRQPIEEGKADEHAAQFAATLSNAGLWDVSAIGGVQAFDTAEQVRELFDRKSPALEEQPFSVRDTNFAYSVVDQSRGKSRPIRIRSGGTLIALIRKETDGWLVSGLERKIESYPPMACINAKPRIHYSPIFDL